MIRRAFYSSPFRSHTSTKHDAIQDAMLGMMRLRQPPTSLRMVVSLEHVENAETSVVWSPLIEGEIMGLGDREAEEWCVSLLREGPFNLLVRSLTIPRRRGCKSFCDVEEDVAREIGMQVADDIDLEYGLVSL